MVWNRKHKTSVPVANEATTTLFQWQQAQVTQNRLSSCLSGEVWKPPPPGWLTCNVDVALFDKENKISLGCILRNDSGDFVAGYGGRLTGAFEPRVAEALAFREARSWLKKLDKQQVYIELDNLSVVEAIRTKSRDNSFFGSILIDCSDILKDLRSHYVYFVMCILRDDQRI